MWCNLSRQKNVIPTNGFDSRYPPTPHPQSIGAIKKIKIKGKKIF